MEEPAGEDCAAGQAAVPDAIRLSAERDLPEPLRAPAWPNDSSATPLRRALAEWARACPRPLVLFFDEIDALRGESLRSVTSPRPC